jgi:hypothetical protein
MRMIEKVAIAMSPEFLRDPRKREHIVWRKWKGMPVMAHRLDGNVGIEDGIFGEELIDILTEALQ